MWTKKAKGVLWSSRVSKYTGSIITSKSYLHIFSCEGTAQLLNCAWSVCPSIWISPCSVLVWSLFNHCCTNLHTKLYTTVHNCTHRKLGWTQLYILNCCIQLYTWLYPTIHSELLYTTVHNCTLYIVVHKSTFWVLGFCISD